MTPPARESTDDLITRQCLIGVGLSPRQILSVYDAAQWESFINEWLNGLKKEYSQVQRFSGSGDKGRDVVGFVNAPGTTGPWDLYQCKHYSSPLTPTEIWVELGKICYYCHRGDYTIPRRYLFVAPHEVGPKLKDLLLNPTDLRKGLIANWKKYCENEGITASKQIPLEGDLRTYVENFDFSVVSYAPLLNVLEQHRKTPYWHERFTQKLPARPPTGAVPEVPTPDETRYLQKLLGAYGDAEGREFKEISEIAGLEKYHNHLKRSRQWFFQAEALNRFSRDNYQDGAFDEIKQQVFDGVVDIAEKSYGHGFERLTTTTDHAGGLTLGNSALAPLAAVGDKKGICHHLSNEDRLHWIKEK